MFDIGNVFSCKSSLSVLLSHFSQIEDPRDVRRISHPLPEILLLVVCGTICGCDDYEDIAGWGETHLEALRQYLPYKNGVPGERWLTLLMNRINPALFADAFAAWVRATWPGKADMIAIDGKTLRRSHDKSDDRSALHLVSAFASTAKLVLAHEAVPDKANELAAIEPLLTRLGAQGGLKGAIVSIDAIATNATIAQAITDQGADYLLAVKANQPTLRAEVESAFDEANGLETHVTHDKGHGRIEQRTTSVLREINWMDGPRRFPGEMRLPGAACIIRVQSQVTTKAKTRTETRYFISSRAMTQEDASNVVRNHWAIENSLHWVLDVTFAEDQSRLRKGHGARNMATVRHFAFNMVRSVNDRYSIKSRRKRASWDPKYLNKVLQCQPG